MHIDREGETTLSALSHGKAFFCSNLYVENPFPCNGYFNVQTTPASTGWNTSH